MMSRSSLRTPNARRLGKTARVHVKVDSGFGRNGFTPAGFDAALAKLVPLAKEGVLHIVGQAEPSSESGSPRLINDR